MPSAPNSGAGRTARAVAAGAAVEGGVALGHLRGGGQLDGRGPGRGPDDLVPVAVQVADEAHELYLAMLEPVQMHEAHVNLIQHGRKRASGRAHLKTLRHRIVTS